MILLALLLQSPVPVLPTEAGVYVSQEEISDLALSGAAWEALLDDADLLVASPVITIANQDDKYDSYAMAAALVWAATGDEAYRTAVETALLGCIGTEGDDFPGENNTSLELSRNVAALAIAADVLEWTDPSAEDLFQTWLRHVLTFERGDGRSIVSTHEDRPNNWGTHAGASRAAIASYLQDEGELARCAQVFKGWLGDRASYTGFTYGVPDFTAQGAPFSWGDLSWQADQDAPVGVNPIGSRLDGYPVGGVLPDDQRRCGSFPEAAGCQTNYAYEALQGVLVQAIVLRRAGYDTWRWQNKAIRRAAWWLVRFNNQPPEGDDLWQPHILLRIYPHPRLAALLPRVTPTNPGKAVGYSDWLTTGALWP